MLNRILSPILAGAMLLSLASCSSTTSNTSTQPSIVVAEGAYDLANMTDPIEALSGIPADTIVAVAGEVELTAQEVLFFTASELSTYHEMMAMYGLYDLPWDLEGEDDIFASTMLQAGAEAALLHRLIPTIADDLEIVLSETDLAELSALLDSVYESVNQDDTLHKYLLWQALLTEDLFDANMHATTLYAYVSDYYFSEGGLMYPDTDEIIAQVEEEGYYRTKHILINTVDLNSPIFDEYGGFAGEFAPLSDEEIAAATDLINELYATLSAETGDLEALFDSLMLEYTQDLDYFGQPNGLDGYQVPLDEMVEPYETASLATKIGEISDIVTSTYGYHIILRLPLVADENYVYDTLNQLAHALQQSWIDENPVILYDPVVELNLKEFYESYSAFRLQLNETLDLALNPAVEEEIAPDAVG